MPMRVTHWINLICMACLIFSGFLIHFPFWAALTGVARGAHVFLGIVLLVNCIVRIVFAFLLQTAPTGGTRNLVRDYKTWLPQADNRHQLGSWIKYYLFIKKDHPLSAKLGVPQKISYLCIPVLIIFMFFTGLCLWPPCANMPLFEAAIAGLGGAMSVRIIHYFMMFVFIAFTLLHAYLANIEGLAPSMLMFFGKEHGGLTYDIEKHNISGKDVLAH